LAEILSTTDREDVPQPTEGTRRGRGRRAGQLNRWSRTFHVYVSMGCMLIVAFFALTGLTLNHPTWSLGPTTTTTKHGSVPAGAISGTTPDFLAISEYARNSFGVTGQVKDYGTNGDVGHIDYAGPGYSASVTFSLSDGSLAVTVTQGDLLAILNDVHKGRDTTSSWSWVIDASAVLLLVVSVTGLGIQIFQRKRRQSALITAGLLSLAAVLLIWYATQ
jgi:uncharacterized protein